MLLAVDIGNTNISLGVFRGKHLLRRYALPTKSETYLSQLRKVFTKNKIDDAVICSVVPFATIKIAKDLRKLSGKRPQIIGRDINIPIKNLYRNPRQVGQDRLVNAFAGISFFGAPLIVVDFGTAVTLDVVSRNKEYLGGLILPGLEISLDCLAERAALLPQIKLSRPRELIGRDTKNSMLSGVIYGFACLADCLIERIKPKIGKNAQVAGTGGNIHLMEQYCQNIDKIDSDLTIKGLNLLYNNLKPII